MWWGRVCGKHVVKVGAHGLAACFKFNSGKDLPKLNRKFGMPIVTVPGRLSTHRLAS
jgi:hypothetical protein